MYQENDQTMLPYILLQTIVTMKSLSDQESKQGEGEKKKGIGTYVVNMNQSHSTFLYTFSPEKEWDETPDLPLAAHSDRRLKRLLNREVDDHRIERHRHIHEPEIIGTEDEGISQLESAEQDGEVNFSKNARRWESSEEEDEAEDLDEDDIERRRMIARQKAVIKQQEEVDNHIFNIL